MKTDEGRVHRLLHRQMMALVQVLPLFSHNHFSLFFLSFFLPPPLLFFSHFFSFFFSFSFPISLFFSVFFHLFPLLLRFFRLSFGWPSPGFAGQLTDSRVLCFPLSAVQFASLKHIDQEIEYEP